MSAPTRCDQFTVAWPASQRAAQHAVALGHVDRDQTDRGARACVRPDRHDVHASRLPRRSAPSPATRGHAPARSRHRKASLDPRLKGANRHRATGRRTSAVRHCDRRPSDGDRAYRERSNPRVFDEDPQHFGPGAARDNHRRHGSPRTSPRSGTRSGCLERLQLSVHGARASAARFVAISRYATALPVAHTTVWNFGQTTLLITSPSPPDQARRPAGGLDCRRHVGCDRFAAGRTPFRKSQ